jgi:proteasome lid subunit RPN8/RPN11
LLQKEGNELPKINIKIDQSTYEEILIHILQFGNKSLKKTQEVLGLIFGIRSGDSVEIKKSIPIKHGSGCEKTFTETDFVNFSEIETKVLQESEGLEVYGYYTSHPKMGYYLSQNDIKNLLYFIEEKKNDYAIALIGDHAQLENDGDTGLKGFYLNNPEKGQNSDFSEINVEIQKPSGFDLIYRTKYLIEQAQRRQPYVEEQGAQLEASDSIWDSFADTESEEDVVLKKISPMLDTLKPDIPNVNESFIKASLLSFNEFTDNLTQFVSKTSNDQNDDLIAMRENIDFGMGNVINWFEKTFAKHAEKIIGEYKRTFDMVQDSHDLYLKTYKQMLINSINENVRRNNELKKLL